MRTHKRAHTHTRLKLCQYYFGILMPAPKSSVVSKRFSVNFNSSRIEPLSFRIQIFSFMPYDLFITNYRWAWVIKFGVFGLEVLLWAHPFNVLLIPDLPFKRKMLSEWKCMCNKQTSHFLPLKFFRLSEADFLTGQLVLGLPLNANLSYLICNLFCFKCYQLFSN